jgi:hypothetical protein
VSSCKKDEKRIIGVWKIEKTELKEFECSNPVMTAMLRPMVQQTMGSAAAFTSGIEMEFTKNGKVIGRTPYGTDEATYKVSNGKLIITDKDGSITTYEISFPDRKTMCATTDADIELSELLQLWLLFGESMDMDIDDVQVTKCRVMTTYTKK